MIKHGFADSNSNVRHLDNIIESQKTQKPSSVQCVSPNRPNNQLVVRTLFSCSVRGQRIFDSIRALVVLFAPPSFSFPTKANKPTLQQHPPLCINWSTGDASLCFVPVTVSAEGCPDENGRSSKGNDVPTRRDVGRQ